MSSLMEAELDEITAEELAALRRIRAKAQGQQHTEYRKALLARIACKDPSKKPPLPGGAYQTYRLAAGRHIRYDQKDVKANAEANQEKVKRLGPAAAPDSPPEHMFVPGDLITPETDGEALMMDQDAGKFRPVGPSQTSENVDELMAEIARLKQTQSRKEDLDQAAADLAKREEELKKREEELKKKGGRG